MLFNSPWFVFIFLPVFLAGFFLFGSFDRRLAVAWAFAASLAFYIWDDPMRLLPLILVSIAFNFAVGRRLAHARSRSVLFVGVSGNILLLLYFKYASFLVNSFGALTGLSVPHVAIALPIGISFYTFTQIAFLIDAFRQQAREYAPLKYGLFVTNFPHLIAGPIIHHKEIMPQFDRPETYRPQLDLIALGIAWFSIGIFKKMLADRIAAFVEAPFRAALTGTVSFSEAWTGTLSYALQIYFDFSGYSDMAIGLALMMGITFPLNFDSPYKATSLIDFWRRWHMTLSRFLRDYLYIPLGGNRHGGPRRYANLLMTMVLGGLWHGASWNFAVWGAIHGVGLALNHLWRGATGRFGVTLPAPVGWAVTSFVVVTAWVPFRADTMGAAMRMWQGMADVVHAGSGLPRDAACWIAALSAIALFAPNTQQILGHAGMRAQGVWTPRMRWAAVLGCLFGAAMIGAAAQPTYFLYFRF